MKFKLFLITFILYGCGPALESNGQLGFEEGYRAGYDFNCYRESSVLLGNWGNEKYLSGYLYGYDVGKVDCEKGVKRRIKVEEK